MNHALDEASAAVAAAGGQLDIHVNLARADVSDSDLASLPLPATTTKIDLSYSKITDDGLRHLQRFETLQEIHIAGTQVTDAGLEHLMKLENLRLINADQSKISRKGQLKLIKFLAGRVQTRPVDARTSDTSRL
ncbi:MAG: hypothetical protein MI757_18380 [Pirellulales bacterium]|nr:hypothetical protein [Pirellulales bacterium]